MHNVRIVTDIVTSADFAFAVSILAPKVVCPLPAWLSRDDQIGTGSTNYGYYVPTPADLEADPMCVAVNLWRKCDRIHAQWTGARRAHLFELYYPESWPGDGEVDPALGRVQFISRVSFFLEGYWLRELVSLYGHLRAYGTIGCAFNILERHGGIGSWLDQRAFGDDDEARAFAFVLALFALQWEVSRKVGYRPHLFGPCGEWQHAQAVPCHRLFESLVSAWAAAGMRPPL